MEIGCVNIRISLNNKKHEKSCCFVVEKEHRQKDVGILCVEKNIEK
jgi:hypothetical protein